MTSLPARRDMIECCRAARRAAAIRGHPGEKQGAQVDITHTGKARGRLVRQVRHAKSPAVPHPGLLLLHGRGADENDLFSFSSALDQRLVVVSPRAPLPLMGGYMWYEIQA